MDSGELDFYQHTKVCSNTCRSTKIDLVGTKASASADQASADILSASSSSADRELWIRFWIRFWTLASEQFHGRFLCVFQ